MNKEIELLRAKAFATMEQNMAAIFQEMEQIRGDNRELEASVAGLLKIVEDYGKANSEARKQMQIYQKQLLQLMKSAQQSNDGGARN